MPIPYVLATIALVWWLGLRLRGPLAGCLAAFLFGLLSTDPYLYGNGANMEHFINLFAVASLAAMVRAFGSPSRRWLVLAGACVAAASLVKQVAALHGLIYVVTVLFLDRGSDSKVKDLVGLAVGFFGTWALAVGVLWLQGAGPSAFEDIVTYGSALATIKVPDPQAPPKLIRWFTGNASPEGILPPPFGKTLYLVWWGTGSWPIWLASVPSITWLLFTRRGGLALPDEPHRQGKPCPTRMPESVGLRRLVAGWTLSCWVQVALPGLFWAHYYLLPTPGLALAVAVALADAMGWQRASWHPLRFGGLVVGSVVSLVLLAGIGATVRLQIRDYLLVPPEDLTTRFKGGYQWVVLRAMGREIGRRTSDWDRPSLYIWGIQSPLLIYSGLDSPTRHFFVDPLLEDYSKGFHREDPRVRPRVDRILKDLEAHPPTLALVDYVPFPELQRFLKGRSILSKVEVLGRTLPIWVDREHYPRFAATAGSASPATAR